MRNMKFNVQIREKDRQLFWYLYENKVALSAQINRDIFSYDKPNSLFVRLIRLERAGWIKTARIFELSPPQRGYSLSEKALTEFIGREHLIREDRWSGKVTHDLDLVDIRSAFSQFRNLEFYYTETMLLARAAPEDKDILIHFETVHPDAVVRLRFPQGSYRLALEYEASLKYYARYQENLFQKYYRKNEISAVLYIAKSEALLHRIRAYEERYRNEAALTEKPKFFYITLNHLKEKFLTQWQTISGETLELEKRDRFQVAVNSLSPS